MLRVPARFGSPDHFYGNVVLLSCASDIEAPQGLLDVDQSS